jgi:hypothetical protein
LKTRRPAIVARNAGTSSSEEPSDATGAKRKLIWMGDQGHFKIAEELGSFGFQEIFVDAA